MKRVAFLFVILLLCAFTKEIEEMDIYYEGEKRQKSTFEPEQGILLGAFIKEDKQIESMEQFEKMTNKHDIYGFTATLTEEFPMMDILECYVNQKIPLLVIQPSDRSNPFETQHLEEAAKKISQYRIPLLVDFYPNGEDYSNGEAYKKYYQQAREVFRKNAPNTVFIWTMAIENIEKWKAYYPEDVDWIGLSIYENGGKQGENIEQMLERWYAVFQKQKPLILSQVAISHYSENGSKYTEKEASDEITRLYHSLQKYPAIKAVVYHSVNLTRQGGNAVKGENYSIVENKRVLEAYQKIKTVHQDGTWYKSFWKKKKKNGIVFIPKNVVTQELQADCEIVLLEGKEYVKNIVGYEVKQKQGNIFLYKQ